MKNKKILLLSIFIFMIVLSIGVASAQDVDDAVASSDVDIVLEDSEPISSGSVSGGVDVVTENPWATSGELNYDIPADAKTIKSADVYVNVYSGSAANSRGANANITITTNNGQILKSEELWIPEGSADGTVYTVNDHTTKCYSDYMIHYDITDSLPGLNGTALKINVNTFEMEGKTFDGRIKLIALVLAYDDGDDDVINYWINDNQIWTNSNTQLTFNTTSLKFVSEAYLTNIALSSNDATYKFNDEFLTDAVHQSGNYYQYNKWNITDLYTSSNPNEFIAYGTAGSYGISYKNALSVLTAKKMDIESTVSLATERKNNNVDIAYPGTYNQIKVTINTNKKGKYVLELLADGEVVNTTEVSLEAGSSVVTLIDPTIRPINEATAYAPGAYNNVTYTANLIFDNEMINTASLKAGILYNGYFAKDLAYPGQDFSSFYTGEITGDIVIDVSSEAYVSGTANRNDVWNVVLPDNSSFVKAWVYVAYSGAAGDTINLFNVTFNNIKPAAVFFSRDQANVISTSGYGLIVYDVTDLIKSGENTFVLNKTSSAGAYPSTLIYLYNTTGSEFIKEIYISNGADLFGTYGNTAGRTLQLDTTLNVNSLYAIDATAYIFGSGSQTGRATIVINGEENATAWDTSASNQINIYTKNITGTVKDVNNVSIVLNNAMFTALHQIVVLTKPKPVSTTITAPAVTTLYNFNKNLVITLKDADKKPVANAKVTVVLNGVKKVLTTNDKGQATLVVPANLVPKSYIASISYDGDATHRKSSAKAKVVVKKANVRLTALNKAFKVKVTTKNYIAALKDLKNKPIKKVVVTLKVKGKLYKAITNAKGQAVFKIKNLPKKGKYIAIVAFQGNNYYNKVAKKVLIAVA